jgi:bifunctional non-homologous end joining protein LigD
MGAGARRSADWLKIKTARRQEAVIVGFTAPRRSRPYFGALVLAVGDRDGWR